MPWPSGRLVVTDNCDVRCSQLHRNVIQPTEKCTEKIEAALQDAQLIVPILSTNWVGREWCVKELARFVELKPEDSDKRIVLIKKTDPPEDAVPGLLRDREGYKFFVKDP